jgi:hypothetical protein
MYVAPFLYSSCTQKPTFVVADIRTKLDGFEVSRHFALHSRKDDPKRRVEASWSWLTPAPVRDYLLTGASGQLSTARRKISTGGTGIKEDAINGTGFLHGLFLGNRFPLGMLFRWSLY